MFTGIIEEVGHVASIGDVGGGKRLGIQCSFAHELTVDESVAVNGVCLTVVSTGTGTFDAVAIEETLNKSTLGGLSTGSVVNLERAMRFGGRIDGHVVQGHVDGTGVVSSIESKGSSHEVWIETPREDGHLLIPKGSVSLDGISLTVADLKESRLKVAIIPHTFENTNVRTWRTGAKINIEYDMIGKYVVRYLQGLKGADSDTVISPEWLKERGF